jgi:hypothetical protein
VFRKLKIYEYSCCRDATDFWANSPTFLDIQYPVRYWICITNYLVGYWYSNWLDIRIIFCHYHNNYRYIFNKKKLESTLRYQRNNIFKVCEEKIIINLNSYVTWLLIFFRTFVCVVANIRYPALSDIWYLSDVWINRISGASLIML